MITLNLKSLYSWAQTEGAIIIEFTYVEHYQNRGIDIKLVVEQSI